MILSSSCLPTHQWFSALAVHLNPWGSFKQYYCLGSSPDQLNQNLLGLGPRLQDFLKLPGDKMGHQH